MCEKVRYVTVDTRGHTVSMLSGFPLSHPCLQPLTMNPDPPLATTLSFSGDLVRHSF